MRCSGLGRSLYCAPLASEQARIVFRFAREGLEPSRSYRFTDSANRIGIVHKATNTRLRVFGSNGKTAVGLVNCPLGDLPMSRERLGSERRHLAP